MENLELSNKGKKLLEFLDYKMYKGEYASKIQDTLAEYIVEKLNFMEKENKTEEK